MIYSKRGYEFSFTWIFTVFVGAVIIFFAIYLAIQIAGTHQAERDTSQGKSLGVLLTPIETEIEEGKFATIYLTDPTRIYFECETPQSSGNPFGSQDIGLSIKPPIGKKWEEPSSPMVTFHNKYFFPTANPTDEENIFMAEGEQKFYVLSKPFYLPFKIADLMIIYSDKEQYCFDLRHAPTDFRDKIQRINMTNVFFNNCDPSKQTTVCFSGSTCEVTIYPTTRPYVYKNGEYLYYLKSNDLNHDPYAMLYAAIFTDPKIYNCQVKRLMAHTSKLLDIYYSKSTYLSRLSGLGCGSGAQPTIIAFNATVASAALTGDISAVNSYMAQPDFQQFQNLAGGDCELF
jgi:hypothetical protein